MSVGEINPPPHHQLLVFLPLEPTPEILGYSPLCNNGASTTGTNLLRRITVDFPGESLRLTISSATGE